MSYTVTAGDGANLTNAIDLGTFDTVGAAQGVAVSYAQAHPRPIRTSISEDGKLIHLFIVEPPGSRY